MASIDFLLENEQPLPKIKQVMSECLGVPESAVALIEDVADYPVSGMFYAVCKVNVLPSGFKQLITVDWPAFAADGFIECVANHFGVGCLVPSKELNPYKMELGAVSVLRSIAGFRGRL